MILEMLRARGFNNPNLRVGTHMMGWHPNPTSRLTAYTSNNAATIQRQLQAMKAFGISVVVLTWQGTTVDPKLQNVADLLSQQIAADGTMQFMLLLDPGIVKYRVSKANTPEQEMSAQLSSAAVQTILNRPGYRTRTVQVDPYTVKTVRPVLDFDTQVDFTKVAPGPTPVEFWMRHVDYSWPEIVSTIPTFKTNNALPSMKGPGVAFGFFDGGYPHDILNPAMPLFKATGGIDWNTSSWGPGVGAARLIAPMAGQTFLQSLDTINKNTDLILLVTWNDYDEKGTAIEPYVSGFTGVDIY